MQTVKINRSGPAVPAALLLSIFAAGPAFADPATGLQTDALRGALDADYTVPVGGDQRGSVATYAPASPGAVPDATDIADADPFDETIDKTDRSQTTLVRKRRQEADETDATTTGAIRRLAVDSRSGIPDKPSSERVQPIEGLAGTSDENPFQAVGIRWGSFVLKPTLESGIAATTNADFSVGGSSAVLSETTLRIRAESDLPRHRATVDAFGTFQKTLSGEEVDYFEGGLDATMEIELDAEYRATGSFTYSVAPESAASPVVVPDAIDEPIAHTLGGSLGLEKHTGKARFAVTGGILHETYGDADLESGGVLSQSDRDSTLYTLAWRMGYEISPILTPFVETQIGRDQYDQEVDNGGYRRSADLYAFRGGIEFDRGEKFSGEIAVGWATEHYDDDRLEPLSTPTVEAGILWSPLRGTNVRLSGSTDLEGTTTPGESGSVLYSTSIEIERLIRANLTGNVRLGFGYRNYAGSNAYDVLWNTEAGLTWWLSRYAGITGRLRHEDVSSNLVGRDADATSVFLGLKLQR